MDETDLLVELAKNIRLMERNECVADDLVHLVDRCCVRPVGIVYGREGDIERLRCESGIR